MSLEGVAAVRMIPAAPRNLWATAWWRYARNPVRVLAAAAALVIVAASVLAPLLAPTRYDVSVIAESLQQPSVRHWLGTDAIGRDVVSRLLYGGRTSLGVALAVVALAGLGAGSGRLVRRHILPNTVGPLIVVITLTIPRMIFAEASLSFLGLGINDPLPSWGKMVSESVSYMQVYPVLGIAPTVMIALMVLTLTLVGDGLRDALDPSRGQPTGGLR